MSLGAPKLYIGGALMSGAAGDSRPALAGVSIDWGTDSMVDFAPPATMSCELLLKPGAAPFTGNVGTEIALIDPVGRTYFAGRIASLKSRRDERIKGANRIAITAVDTLADFSQHRVEKINWTATNAYSTTGGQRRAQIAGVVPSGWIVTGQNSNYDWVTVRGQRWIGRELLPIIDQYLRSTNARRHTTSSFTPGSGISRSITITPERSKGTPPSGTTVAIIPASNIRDDLEWEKNPDDTITDLKLTSHGITYPDDDPERESSSTALWVDSYTGVNQGPLQASHGVHSLELDVDTLGGAPGSGSTHISFLVNYWTEVDSKWRPLGLDIADVDLLDDITVRDILDVTKRGMLYVIITQLPAGNPSGYGRVEAYATAGKARWTGKKWEISLTLGRQTYATGTPIGA